jgi:hypothetical protein
MTARSTFDWNTGEPSIFVTDQPQRNQYNGVDADRAASQTRLEPRPLTLPPDSQYLSGKFIRQSCLNERDVSVLATSKPPQDVHVLQGSGEVAQGRYKASAALHRRSAQEALRRGHPAN